MGSWNSTCGLTRLPICAGEPVIGLLIADSGYERRDAGYHCYVTDKYAPVILPFKADYNDYGSVENVEDTQLVKVSHGSFGPIKKSFDQWIDDHVIEGSVFIKEEDDKKKRSVGLWMCRQDIIDNVYKDGGVYENYEKVNGTYKSVKMNLTEKLISDFDKMYAKLVENKEMLAYYFGDKKADPKNEDEVVMQLRAQFGYEYELEDRENIASHIIGQMRGMAGNAIITSQRYEVYREYLKFLVYKGYDVNSKEVSEVRDAVITMYLIHDLMSSNRISMAPQTGAGSQQDELGMYRKMNAAMTKAMYNIKHRWDD